jgi:hypothetical protein
LYPPPLRPLTLFHFDVRGWMLDVRCSPSLKPP